MVRQARPQVDVADVVEVKVNEVALVQAGQSLDALALAGQMADQKMDAVFAAGVDVGRLEAMDFVVTVTTSTLLEIYENARKSKTWQFVRDPRSGHGDHFSSFEEFCEVKLGKSHQRLRKILANRNLLGAEAFEQAERLGLRQVDYNAIKALPAPEQELVRRAVEDATSRDEVLAVLQELAGRFAKTEEQLKAEVQELREEVDAKEKVLQTKSATLDRTQQEVARLQQRIARATPDEVLAQLQREAGGIAATVRSYVQGDLRAALQALWEHGGAASNPHAHNAVMAGLIGQIVADLRALQDQYGLPDIPPSADLDWLQSPEVQALGGKGGDAESDAEGAGEEWSDDSAQ